MQAKEMASEITVYSRKRHGFLLFEVSCICCTWGSAAEAAHELVWGLSIEEGGRSVLMLVMLV